MTEVVTNLNYTLKVGNRTIFIDNHWNNYTCVICPPGSYCTLQTIDNVNSNDEDIVPQFCPFGSYNPDPGQTACIPCDLGKGDNCPVGAVSKSDLFTQAHCFRKQLVLFSPRIESSIGSQLQCQENCRNDVSCFGFAWEEPQSCVFMTSRNQTTLKDFKTKSYTSSSNFTMASYTNFTATQIDLYNSLMTEYDNQKETYSLYLSMQKVVVYEEYSVLTITNMTSIFDSNRQALTMTESNLSDFISDDITQISFNNGQIYSLGGTVDINKLYEFQEQLHPEPNISLQDELLLEKEDENSVSFKNKNGQSFTWDEAAKACNDLGGFLPHLSELQKDAESNFGFPTQHAWKSYDIDSYVNFQFNLEFRVFSKKDIQVKFLALLDVGKRLLLSVKNNTILLEGDGQQTYQTENLNDLVQISFFYKPQSLKVIIKTGEDDVEWVLAILVREINYDWKQLSSVAYVDQKKLEFYHSKPPVSHLDDGELDFADQPLSEVFLARLLLAEGVGERVLPYYGSGFRFSYKLFDDHKKLIDFYKSVFNNIKTDTRIHRPDWHTVKLEKGFFISTFSSLKLLD